MQAICKYLLALLCLLPLFSFAGKPAGEKSFYMVREGKACGIIVWRSGNNYAAEAAKELQYAFAGTAQQTCPLSVCRRTRRSVVAGTAQGKA